MASEPNQPKDRTHVFQPPKGTRDFYPLELARRRWIEDKWRKTAVRHGFDEIDGPTFEHLDLYTVKSGEGIVSELFSFTRQGGDKQYALRPEFTPTLARMAAARANSLPKPTKWFSICPYFRAENPQRGRLREFLQWNVDVIGDDSPQADADCIATCAGLLESVGLTPAQVKLKVSSRTAVAELIRAAGVPQDYTDAALVLLDKRAKLDRDEFCKQAATIQLDIAAFDRKAGDLASVASIESLQALIKNIGLTDWCGIDLSIVRGLAYYTGAVFEVHETTGAERAIAGGGRYDNLIELFGGPPTPAVGFAMGDVVLALVLQDKGLMPKDDEIAADLGLRPDVFVIPTTETEHLMQPLVARLRREGLHARHTYKSTRNVGKLLKEAGNANARFALILESDTVCSLKNLDTNEQTDSVPMSEALERIAPPPRPG
ncbi:MAG: histidine--tRNA ligase [Phycisphaeraceae bacterium]|nr:histidine--tRNA ligase [Phycisphaeraceae bacterium]MCB9847120.1 histidine--tRNA ligase [Phycisphaeraceae bacterium]